MIETAMAILVCLLCPVLLLPVMALWAASLLAGQLVRMVENRRRQRLR